MIQEYRFIAEKVQEYEKIFQKNEKRFIETTYVFLFVILGFLVIFLVFGFLFFDINPWYFVGTLFLFWALVGLHEKKPLRFLIKNISYFFFGDKILFLINEEAEHVIFDLQNYRGYLDAMRKEEHGPWSVWAQKAFKIINAFENNRHYKLELWKQ